MLHLRCQLGEVIKVGDNIEIMVSRIRGREVSLGITAPKEILIERGELRRYVWEKKDSNTFILPIPEEV
jgi:carbon storage regulator